MPSIDLPITWTPPGTTVNGNATVTFTEVKDPKLGYYTRQFTEKDVVWPKDFPEDLKPIYLKPLYHQLNTERQKVVIDDVVVTKQEATPADASVNP